jgi:hypothetical protein
VTIMGSTTTPAAVGLRLTVFHTFKRCGVPYIFTFLPRSFLALVLFPFIRAHTRLQISRVESFYRRDARRYAVAELLFLRTMTNPILKIGPPIRWFIEQEARGLVIRCLNAQVAFDAYPVRFVGHADFGPPKFRNTRTTFAIIHWVLMFLDVPRSIAS